ncbi:MAG: MATE family efflux transporter [Vicingaceae bacterium]
MTDLVRYRNIWQVSYPIILGGVAQNIVNVTDTAFLGRVNLVALGAAGNAGIFYFVLMVVGLGFSIGCQIIMGRRNGEKNYAVIGELFSQGMIFLLPLALLLFFFVQFVSPLILAQVTASPDILAASNEYLGFRSYGILFAFANFIFIAFYTGITKTKVLTYATFLQAGVNVILDYALIFGHFGLPEMGIKGAALASVFSELTALGFFLYYSRYRINYKQYALFQWVGLKGKKVYKLVKVSSPVMLQNFIALGAWLVFFMIVEQMGEKELAASHIVRSIYMVLMIPLFGFSSATSTLVSNLIGEGAISMVSTLVKRIMFLSLTCTLVFLPVILLFPDQMSGIYTNDPSLIKACRPVLYVISAAMFLFSVAYVSFSAVVGTGKTKISLLIEFISISIYLLGAYWIAVVSDASLPLAWMSEFIYFGLMGGLASLYLKFGNWKSTVL